MEVAADGSFYWKISCQTRIFSEQARHRRLSYTKINVQVQVQAILCRTVFKKEKNQAAVGLVIRLVRPTMADMQTGGETNV
jgi:hypothetical protein